MTRPFLIGGEWRSANRASFDSIYPADGSVAATVASATVADVDDAVRCAQAALMSPAWRDLSAHKRAELLARLAQLIEHDARLLAGIQTRDNGKPLKESLAQASAAAEFFRYYVAVTETAEAEVIPSRGQYLVSGVLSPPFPAIRERRV